MLDNKFIIELEKELMQLGVETVKPNEVTTRLQTGLKQFSIQEVNDYTTKAMAERIRNTGRVIQFQMPILPKNAVKSRIHRIGNIIVRYMAYGLPFTIEMVEQWDVLIKAND